MVGNPGFQLMAWSGTVIKVIRALSYGGIGPIGAECSSGRGRCFIKDSGSMKYSSIRWLSRLHMRQKRSFRG